MWTLLLTAQLAVAGGKDDAPRYGPYLVEETKSGDLVVLDGEGAPLPIVDTLLLAGRTDEATAYRRGRATRKAAAWGMWIGGTGLTLLGIGGGDLFNVIPPAPTALLGLGTIGGGYALLYAPQTNRLDHWIEHDALVARMDAVNAADAMVLPEAGDVAGAPRARVAPALRGEPWSVDERGRVRDATGRQLDVPAVAEALGAPARVEAWNAWRREQYATWATVGTVGLGAMIAGVAIGASAEDDTGVQAGVGTLFTGGAMLAGGMAGLAAVDGAWHVPRWFTPEEIDQAIAARSGGAALPAAPPPRPVVTVRPVLSPGYLGVAGTF